MFRMPKVSVIIPVYNSEKYVGEAIESVLKQTYEDFELIIIDDCSTDHSAEVIQSYQDKRIVSVHNEVNKGFLYGLNYGMEIATGDYYARLDNDDICYPTRFEKQVQFLEAHKDVVLLGTRKDLLINNSIVHEKTLPIATPEELKFSILFGNYCMAHSSFMMPMEVLRKNNVKYEIFLQTPDHHIQLTMAKLGKIAMLPEPLIAWRIHPAQSTQIRSQNMKMGEEDKTRRYYIRSLPFKQEHLSILMKAVNRMLETNKDYQEFTAAFIKYADFCGMKTDHDTLTSNRCYQYIFKDILLQQRHNHALLSAYRKSEFKDSQFLLSKEGLEFMIKCIFSMNKKWIGEIDEYKD